MKTSTIVLFFILVLGSTVFVPVKAQDDLLYVAVEPCRLADTRKTSVMADGVSRNFMVSGADLSVHGGDPTGCVHPKDGIGVAPLAASVYIVAVPTGSSGGGWLTAFPSDQSTPAKQSVATVNYTKGQVIGNTTIATLCQSGSCPTDGQLGLVSHNSEQQVVIDVQGYFYPANLGTCPAGAPTRFVDNGDGTICDNKTGLMWEKKDAADGELDYGNPHDADNVYTWTDTTDGDINNPDGRVYDDFLARLNNAIADTAASDTPFAGHIDWRIPNITELRTLLYEESIPCSISPCIVDAVFIPTAAEAGESYWSSTSIDTTKHFALVINFVSGGVGGGGPKDNERHVRAVRSGR